MKYLSDYSQESYTKLWEETGAFFAFSKEQFDAQKKPDVIYSSFGMGLMCPKENMDRLTKGLKEAGEAAKAQDLAENGKEGVIKRELANHEAYYTMEIDDTCYALGGYGISREEVLAVYNIEKGNHHE